ncbi:MAG TPA: DUF1963 domain-containing protein [Candidatus Berkiella sp.]|nr:DUF1963 domain-containing protein [Candidatus Berkiella sp.]
MKKITAIQFNKVTNPITEQKTKFGGQPAWLEEPQWPLDLNGKALHFVGQIVIDTQLFENAQGRIAYLFMSNEDDAQTWDPNTGDSAVIIQPGEPLPSIKCNNQSEGPTLIDGEYEVTLRLKEEVFQIAPELLDEEAYTEYFRQLSGNKIGGTPLFIQGEEYPKGYERLLLQIDSTEVPFNINFGDSGTGYLFINANISQGKFLWQCY